MIVLGCGQIHPRKGVDLFVQVAANVLSRDGMESVVFVWIGDGTADDSGVREDRLNLLDVAGSVHRVGEIGRGNLFEDLANILCRVALE